MHRFNAGVYLLRSHKTGASYVGASVYLTDRLTTHRDGILNGRHASKHIREAFADHTMDDVELRILETVKVVGTAKYPYPLHYHTWNDKRLADGIARLHRRELHWIHKLQPSCNKRGLRKRIEVGRLPVGAPA